MREISRQRRRGRKENKKLLDTSVCEKERDRYGEEWGGGKVKERRRESTPAESLRRRGTVCSTGGSREQREGSELKRFVLPNEVNTPSGRMRPSCRAETVVTSVILYKAGRGRRERDTRVNCREQDEVESDGGSGWGRRRRWRRRRRRRSRKGVSAEAGEDGKKPQTTKSGYASFLLQNRPFASIHLYLRDLSLFFSPSPFLLHPFSLFRSLVRPFARLARLLSLLGRH